MAPFPLPDSSRPSCAAALQGVRRLRRLARPVLSTETLALLASLYFAVASNTLFWGAALADRDWALPATWTYAVSLLIALVCLHLALLTLVLNRWTARLLLGTLILATAVATFFMQSYGVYLDPGMIRNALHSEVKEAGDLVGPALLSHLLLQAGPALLLLCWIRIRRSPVKTASLRRVATLAASLGLLTGAVIFSYQDLSGLFRNQKEVRYLIAPANYLYSTARALQTEHKPGPTALMPVGLDARLGPDWSNRQKPVLLVIVVGETARAANWGLNGYPRDTTPQLARLMAEAPDDLVNFKDVRSCGTDTETSVPCLFSVIGRRDYDERRIRGSESLLHVLARAGFRVHWRDNQTGCKGVCAGLPYEQVDVGQADCEPGRCLDQKLLTGLDALVDAAAPGRAAPEPDRGLPALPVGLSTGQPPGEVVVMHQLGNHGPAYFHRYPDLVKTFTPTCDTAELRRCDVVAIRNSYDNALRYTDHFLAQTIAYLKFREATHDTALIYVSDHGESLGENGLFLHGLPYAIAPAVQTRVPMLMWISPGFRRSFELQAACLRARTDQPLSHDHLFHTVLGLLQVETLSQAPAYDLTKNCRVDPVAQSAYPKPLAVSAEPGILQ